VNHPELINKLSNAQNTIWQTVRHQVAEVSGENIQLNSPLVLETQVIEMLQEFAVPAIIVQFSFAGKQDSTQSVLLPLDTASALYLAVTGTPAAMDESTLEELRPTLEAIVQGICLGVGNTRDEIIIASDLSVRLGRFSRPSNLQPTDRMIRFQLALGVGSTRSGL
jgi:hypothetical protein